MSKGSRRRAACVSQEEVARNWLKTYCNHSEFETRGDTWVCLTCGAEFTEEEMDERCRK